MCSLYCMRPSTSACVVRMCIGLLLLMVVSKATHRQNHPESFYDTIPRFVV